MRMKLFCKEAAFSTKDQGNRKFDLINEIIDKN
jgi:hypothetical protein